MNGMNILAKLFYFLTGNFTVLFNTRSNDDKYSEGECIIADDSYYDSDIGEPDGEYDFIVLNERLHDGRPLLTVVNHQMTDELKFHMAVWWKMAPVNRSAYTFLMHRVDGERYLMVLTDDQKARDDAANWFEQYFVRFNEDQFLSEYIPSLPSGEFNGHVLIRDTSEDNNPPTIFQTWTYILTNFEGKVYRTRLDRYRDIFYFEEESEMLMFKMQHVK